MKKIWINSKGETVPSQYVSKEDKKKNQIVTSVMKEARNIRTKMERFKEEIFKKIQIYMELLSPEHFEDNWKGNLTLTNFYGTEQILVNVKDFIEFDEKLIVAKQIIDECIKEWSGNSNDKIKILVQSSFNTDKKGTVNNYLIIRLTKLKIKDKKWVEAMELIKESMQVKTTKKYINFKQRISPTDKWESVSLDFANI